MALQWNLKTLSSSLDFTVLCYLESSKWDYSVNKTLYLTFDVSNTTLPCAYTKQNYILKNEQQNKFISSFRNLFLDSEIYFLIPKLISRFQNLFLDFEIYFLILIFFFRLWNLFLDGPCRPPYFYLFLSL